MSYTNTRLDRQLISGGDANSTATSGSHSVGIRPFVVRRCAVMVTDDLVGTTLVVTFSKRVTPGTDTGGTTICTITMPAGLTVGALYVRKLDTAGVECSYGDQVYAAVTTPIGTSGMIDVLVDIEDQPDNYLASPAVTVVTS